MLDSPEQSRSTQSEYRAGALVVPIGLLERLHDGFLFQGSKCGPASLLTFTR